jgi:hypothetical protein
MQDDPLRLPGLIPGAMRCPHAGCGQELGAHEVVGSTRLNLVPGERDAYGFTMCWECGELAIFVRVLGSLSLRCPNPDEGAEVEASPVVKALRKAMRDHPYSPHIAIEAFRLAQGSSG